MPTRPQVFGDLERVKDPQLKSALKFLWDHVMDLRRIAETTTEELVVVRDSIPVVPSIPEAKPIPSCRIFNSAAQSIPDTTATMVTFNSIRWDPYEMFNPNKSATRIVIPLTGKWFFGCGGQFATNATGARSLKLLANGTVVASQDFPAAVDQPTVVAVPCLIDLNQGDYMEVQAVQRSGAPLNLAFVAARSPQFWGFWACD